MKRKFITNLSLLLFLNLLIKPFWIFGVDRTVQNVVGAEEYGLYFSLFNFSLLLNMLLDLGITNYNNRNIAQHSQLLSKSLSKIISLKFVLAILYAMVTIAVAFFIGYEWRQFYILIFLIINQFVSSFILYLRSNLSGLHYFKSDSIISVLDRALMISICGVILWGGITTEGFKIEWFVYAQTAAYTVTMIVALILVYSKAEYWKLKFEWRYTIATLKQSFPYALLALLMALYYRIDSVMLERMLPNGRLHAGIYAQGYRVLDAMAMFAFLFAVILLPMFSRMLIRKESIAQLTKFSFLILIVPVVGITMASYFYSAQLMELLYHEHVEISSPVFGVLIICLIGISVSYILGTLLTANGNLKELNLLAVGGVIVNIILNMVLIPKLQVMGSAIASLVTQSLVALVQVILSKRIFRFNFSIKRIIMFVIFILLIYTISLVSLKWGIFWGYKFAGIMAVAILSAFILRLLSLKAIYNLALNKSEP